MPWPLGRPLLLLVLLLLLLSASSADTKHPPRLRQWPRPRTRSPPKMLVRVRLRLRLRVMHLRRRRRRCSSGNSWIPRLIIGVVKSGVSLPWRYRGPARTARPAGSWCRRRMSSSCISAAASSARDRRRPRPNERADAQQASASSSFSAFGLCAFQRHLTFSLGVSFFPLWRTQFKTRQNENSSAE